MPRPKVLLAVAYGLALLGFAGLALEQRASGDDGADNVYWQVRGGSTDGDKDRAWGPPESSKEAAEKELKECRGDYGDGGLLESAHVKPVGLYLQEYRNGKPVRDNTENYFALPPKNLGDTLRGYARSIEEAGRRARELKDRSPKLIEQISEEQFGAVNGLIDSYNRRTHPANSPSPGRAPGVRLIPGYQTGGQAANPSSPPRAGAGQNDKDHSTGPQPATSPPGDPGSGAPTLIIQDSMRSQSASPSSPSPGPAVRRSPAQNVGGQPANPSSPPAGAGQNGTGGSTEAQPANPAPAGSGSGQSRLVMPPDGVGGVRAYYDAQVVRRALRAAGPERSHRLLSALASRLNPQDDLGHQQKVLQDFVHELKAEFKASRAVCKIDDLALVSLKALLTKVERHGGRWEDLPPEVRTPGNLARVRGFILDAPHGDILLLGSRQPRAPALEIDDLIVALRAIWQEGGTPTCSLDPDPQDLASKRVGPQNARLIDLPRDCGFARSLLDADYTMKKMLFGATPVRAAGFTSLEQLLRGASDAAVESVQSRFWFMPVPPHLGDIQVGADGRIALFQSNLEVLTEQVTLSSEGLLAGTGKVNSAADRAAASLTHHLTAIAREQPHFQKLQVLTDLVLLSGLLREGRVKSPLLNRLVRLPYRRVRVPDSYPGIKQTIGGHSQRWLFGGVRLKAPVDQRSWLVLEDEDTKLLRKKALQVHFDDSIAVPLPGVRVHLPVPALLPARRRSNPALALNKLANRQWNDALVEANRAVQDAPDDPLPRTVRALAHLALGHITAAQIDVIHAHHLLLGDPDLDLLLLRLLEFSRSALRESRLAAQPGAGDVVRPGTREAALLRGTVLLLLDEAAEARKQLEKATELDPRYASAYARLALLESTQGFRIRAKQLAEKAMRLNPKLAEAKAVLAESEFRLHHLSTAEQRASEVLAQPIAGLQAKITAYKVLVGAAARRGEWLTVQVLLQQVQKALPDMAQLPLWLFAAEQAYDGGRDDLKTTWLACAERVSPWSRAVVEARRRLTSPHPSRGPRTGDRPAEPPNETPPTPRAPARDAASQGKGEQFEEPESFPGWIAISAVVLIGGAGTFLMVRRHRRAG